MQPDTPFSIIPTTSHEIAPQTLNALKGWAVRAWFAMLLVLCIHGPFAAPSIGERWIDLPLVLFGYLAITALVFDLGSRLGAWGILGTLVLGGITALLAFTFTLPPLPGTEPLLAFLSRVLGGGTLSAWGAWMLGVWSFRPAASMPAPRSHFPIGVWALCALAGILWSSWTTWNATNNAVDQDSFILWFTWIIFLPLMLAAIIFLRLVLARPVDVRHWTFNRHDFQLRRADWLFVAPTLITLFIVRASAGILNNFQTIIAVMLFVMCLAILYFRQQPRRRMIFEGLTTRPSRVGTMLIAGVALYGGVYITSRLPSGIPPRDAPSLVAFGFLTFGIVWLPALTLIIGARAFIKQARAYRL